MIGKSFAIEDYIIQIVVNGFWKQTGEVVMSDVLIVDNIATLSEAV